MSMNLGKGQIEMIAKEVRQQLHAIGEKEREALRVAAREKFFKTKEGKMVLHLRVKFAKEKHCGQVCSEIVSRIEDQACAKMVKPFVYLNIDELCKQVTMASLEANNGEELMDAVKRIWYKKLTPAQRRRFNLKVN